MESKLPPQNLEAEQSVLGSVLLDNETYAAVEGIIRSEHFYKESHRKIFRAMERLFTRHEPMDLVTLTEELRQTGELEGVGSVPYLIGLADSVPTAAYAENYARIVVEKATLRDLIAASGSIMQTAYDQAMPLEQVLDKAEASIFELSSNKRSHNFQSMGDLVSDTFSHINELLNNPDPVSGLRTGFKELDNLTAGLQPSSLNILAARPAMGKTAFALTIGLNVALREGQTVGIFNLEMSAVQLVTRMLCSEARVDMSRVRNGQLSDRDFQRLADTAGKLAEAQIYIDDNADLTVMELRSRARRLMAEHDLGLIVIDYLQLMSGSSRLSGGENRQQEISTISRGLKVLARELDIPVLALSQLSRQVESRPNKRPLLSDLRESGCLTGDTLVYLPDCGHYVPIAKLESKSGFKVSSLNTETWKLETSTVSHAFCTGTKPVFELRTQLGRKVRATANHKFLTARGWKRLNELEKNELIALPRTLPSPEHGSLSKAELALLGHMIGDGCALPRHALQYTTRELDLAETVAALASEIFGTQLNLKIKRERQWYQVYLSAAQTLARGKRNAVAKWLDELGLFGLHSHQKRVPIRVFQQSAEGIAIFLRHLWATDGCARLVRGKSPRPAIYFASSSAQLATDVQALLLRLSINARCKRISQGDRGRDQFHVLVSGRDDCLNFIRCIGGVGEYKKSSLNEIKAWLSNRPANTNRDVISHAIWRGIAVPAMQKRAMTSRELQAAIGMQYCGTSLYKQNVSRERAARLAQAVQSEELLNLSESDVYWDKVASIKPDGTEPVYDLTVPGNHNFVASNIIVHNSIEQDADLVAFIYRDEYYDPQSEKQGIAEIILGKQRNGPVGTVELQFHNAHVRFNDLAKAV